MSPETTQKQHQVEVSNDAFPDSSKFCPNTQAMPAGLHCSPLGSISISGDLSKRASRNYDRLEEEYYQPAHVFSSEMHSQWAGDLEGRTILALVMSAQATGREPKYLETILSELRQRLNEKGYLGVMLGEGLCDEQQLSGHSWLLRGLCEYYLWKGYPAIRDMIARMIENLFLPASDYYANYPALPEQRVFQGEAAGSLTGDLHGNWYTSSDTGCAFIPLDGVTHAYELLRTKPLQTLIENMIAKYITIDFTGICMQTHATLSALRGMLRYYGIVKDSAILDSVKRVFALYKTEAITENYSNYNWFRRPEWTEPCAMVDSFIIAVEMWKYTEDAQYLEDAHHIFYNSLGYGQRPNGGWGPDECAGAHDPFLRPTVESFEAPWCCTMRGADGLARAIAYSYFQEGDQIMLPFYNDNTAHFTFDDGEVQWCQTSEYPVGGRVCITVLSSTIHTPKTVCFHLPSWTNAPHAALRINGQEAAEAACKQGWLHVPAALAQGDVLELQFDIPLRQCPTINSRNIQGHFTFRHGPMILGISNPGEAVSAVDINKVHPIGEGQYEMGDGKSVLKPFLDLFYQTEAQARQDQRQILFPVPSALNDVHIPNRK